MLLKSFLLGASLVASTCAATLALADPVPTRFESVGADRSAIDGLLAKYARAVSTKDQALFETLILDRTIPFAPVPQDGVGTPGDHIHRYEDFRQAVFDGPPFTQRFRDVRVEQDGGLANVTLVFENTASDGASWGWKTLQLVKVDGAWKIASEFFTGHAGESSQRR